MNNCLGNFEELYRSSAEYKSRELLGGKVTVINLETMCTDDKLSNYVFKPLLELKEVTKLSDVEDELSFGAKVTKVANYYQAVDLFVNGNALIFVEGDEGCVAVDCRTTVGRAVAEPPTSMVMRGPREGFVESAKTNMSLLRKRLKTPCFKTVELTVGKYTNTAVSVCYVDGVADSDLVSKVTQSINAITVDGVIDSSGLASRLDPNRTWLFRRVGMTEKPDVAVGKLLEGRIAVVVDGSPMVLTLPYLYIEDLQSPGDYYDNSALTSVSRVLRLVSVLASLLLPSLYVCFQMYNYQIIPLNFLVTIKGATENIPFTPMVEMLLIIVIFDILREANLRMPSLIGISLSLVGAIVLGDAAVQAGLFGSPAVMIGALSGIGLFAMPDNTLVLSVLRLVVTFVGGLAGVYGVALCLIAMLLYLTALNNYDTPFLAPFAPEIEGDHQDAVMQKTAQNRNERPESIGSDNKTRQI